MPCGLLSTRRRLYVSSKAGERVALGVLHIIRLLLMVNIKLQRRKKDELGISETKKLTKRKKENKKGKP